MMRRKRAKNRNGCDNAPDGERLRAKLLFPGEFGGLITKWKLQVNKPFEAGSVLATCKCRNSQVSEPLNQVDLIAPFDGTLLEIFKNEGENIPALWKGDDSHESQNVARISYCKHDIVLPEFGLCGVCGRLPSQVSCDSLAGEKGESAQDGDSFMNQGHALIDPSNATSASMTLNVAGGSRVIVSHTEAHDDRKKTVERLFRARKLLLVLDIDHTMLHAVDDSAAPSFARAKGLENMLHSFFLEDASKSGKCKMRPHYCMLRPGLEKWLDDISKFYELYIYTAGTRSYAEAMAKIIDPSGKLFGTRIISRTDTPELGTIKLLERIFPVDNSMVLAVDDRRDVWTQDSSNLVTIRPYHFFKGLSDVNNASGPQFSLSKKELELKDNKHRNQIDPGLKRVAEVLKWIHGKFYTDSITIEEQLNKRGNDVKELVKAIRKRILRPKVSLVIDFPEENIEGALIKDLAICCGATCTKEIEAGTTAVISNDSRSAMALEGKSKNVWVVHSDWLRACFHYWNKEPFVFYSLFSISRSSNSTLLPRKPGADSNRHRKLESQNATKQNATKQNANTNHGLTKSAKNSEDIGGEDQVDCSVYSASVESDPGS